MINDNIPNIVPQVGAVEYRVHANLTLPWPVERLFPVDPQLKESKNTIFMKI